MISLILAIMLSIGGSPAVGPGNTGIQAQVDNNPKINRIFEDYTQKTASRPISKKIPEIPLINHPKTQTRLIFTLPLKEKLYLRGYEDSMNLYQAFNMNPINFTDPFGLLTQEQRRKVGSQVFRLIMAPTKERKIAALNALQAYRAEFGELTQEDIVDVFGENDYVLAATNLDIQTMLNYAGAKIALGISDLSTSYNPAYSSRYGGMNARTEIDPQSSMIDLYNSVVGSRKRIQRMSFGKRQGLWVNEAITDQNYEAVIAKSMEKEQKSRIFAFAMTSFFTSWSQYSRIIQSRGKNIYKTWNEFQSGTKGKFSSRPEAGQAWEAYKSQYGIVTGTVRNSAAKIAFLKQLAASGKAPKWMNQWLKQGNVPPGYEVDHIVPLSVGGEDIPLNMRLVDEAFHDLHHSPGFYRPWEY